jgi:hypothetical protein
VTCRKQLDDNIDKSPEDLDEWLIVIILLCTAKPIFYRVFATDIGNK